MSWDTHLEIDTGGDCPARIGSYEDSYTWNVASMFYDAFANPDGLRGLHGTLCADAAEQLDEAITAMQVDPGHYRAMNPKNGWGDYEGALKFLIDMRSACLEHPRATLRIY